MTLFSPNDFSHQARFAIPATTLEQAEIALVMPCYNEAARLDSARILDFIGANPKVHLIFVNDGSTDQTLDLLLALRRLQVGRITVLDMARNAGKAEAVRQGLLHALTLNLPLVAYWDADLATPLDAVEDFARIARRYPQVEVIFGSRRQMLGHRIHRRPVRRMVSRVCAGLARLALALPTADTQCGAKMLRAGPGLAHALAKPFTAGWLFDVELFARLAKAMSDRDEGFYEFPLAEWAEIPGSKVSGRAILRAGTRMLGLIAEHRLGWPASDDPQGPLLRPRVFAPPRTVMATA